MKLLFLKKIIKKEKNEAREQNEMCKFVSNFKYVILKSDNINHIFLTFNVIFTKKEINWFERLFFYSI